MPRRVGPSVHAFTCPLLIAHRVAPTILPTPIFAKSLVLWNSTPLAVSRILMPICLVVSPFAIKRRSEISRSSSAVSGNFEDDAWIF